MIDPDAEVTGAFLRKVRQTRGIELGDISQRTKISERYLRAIEEERFADMPAAVYVRGYVMEFARALRMDAHRVTESYLARYRKARPRRRRWRRPPERRTSGVFVKTLTSVPLLSLWMSANVVAVAPVVAV